MEHREFFFTMFGAAAQTTRRLDRSLSSIRGISFSEYQLLAAIGAKPAGSATRVDLADTVGLTPSGVTRALKPLEKLGYVETTKDERDARRSLASLTSAGVELVADADAVVDDVLNKLDGIAKLSAPERKKVMTILQGLAHG